MASESLVQSTMQEPNDLNTQSQIEVASCYIYEQGNEDKCNSRNNTTETARILDDGAKTLDYKSGIAKVSTISR